MSCAFELCRSVAEAVRSIPPGIWLVLAQLCCNSCNQITAQKDECELFASSARVVMQTNYISPYVLTTLVTLFRKHSSPKYSVCTELLYRHDVEQVSPGNRTIRRCIPFGKFRSLYTMMTVLMRNRQLLAKVAQFEASGCSFTICTAKLLGHTALYCIYTNQPSFAGVRTTSNHFSNETTRFRSYHRM